MPEKRGRCLSRRLALAACLLFFSFGQVACVFVRTDKARTVQVKTAVGQPTVERTSFHRHRLTYEATAGEDLVFRLSRITTVHDYSRQKYRVEGREHETIARDKEGRFKFFFAGPAWVTEDSGAGNYAKTLALSTCMTLGFGLIVAAVDWISLPFRLGRSGYKIERSERKPIRRDSRSGAVPADAVLKFARKGYKVESGRVRLPAAVFFARRRRFPYGRIGFRIQNGAGEPGPMNHLRMGDIFASTEEFDRVTKDLPAYAPAPVAPSAPASSTPAAPSK